MIDGSDQRSGSEYSQPQYPHQRFRRLFAVLVLLVVVIALVQQFGPQPEDVSPVSDTSLQADLAMKLSYACQRWSLAYKGKPAQQSRVEDLAAAQQRSAVMAYERAVEQSPSPASIRRLIIICPQADKRSAIERLSAFARRKSLSAHDRSALAGEAAMWRDIYLGRTRLETRRVEKHASTIRSLDLGWYEHLALADLYQNSGMPARAAQQHLMAQSSATQTISRLAVLLVSVGVLAFIGIIVLAWYSSLLRVRWQSDDTAYASGEARDLVAGSMLEVFVAYVVILVVVQVVAASMLSAGMIDVDSLGPTSEAFFTSGVYALSGILALVYLASRLRTLGFSWHSIRLTTTGPGHDILWGVLGYSAALPLLVITGLISQIVGRFVQSPTNPVIPLFVETESITGRVAIFLLVAVVAPFFEELFFRGVLFTSLRARWGVAAGIIGSATVFAAVHPLPVGFLPILMLGIVLATLVHERKSLLPAMVAHGLNNTAAFLLLLILTG